MAWPAVKCHPSYPKFIVNLRTGEWGWQTLKVTSCLGELRKGYRESFGKSVRERAQACGILSSFAICLLSLYWELLQQWTNCLCRFGAIVVKTNQQRGSQLSLERLMEHGHDLLCTKREWWCTDRCRELGCRENIWLFSSTAARSLWEGNRERMLQSKIVHHRKFELASTACQTERKRGTTIAGSTPLKEKKNCMNNLCLVGS